jgi:hypothetical protein
VAVRIFIVVPMFLSFDSRVFNKCILCATADRSQSLLVTSFLFFADGGKCLKILKTYVGNVVDNPQEEKFKTVNMENKTFRGKVKPFIGSKNLLIAVGFKLNEKGDSLVLEDDADMELLAATKAKLEKAMVAYE